MLFDDNLGFFGFAVPKNMKISSDSDLTSIADGFSKGNMFNNLYLYLDLHPTDEQMLKKFKELAEKSCAKEMEYVKTYGPLEVIDNNSLSKFNWINNPWPWENTGGTKYV